MKKTAMIAGCILVAVIELCIIVGGFARDKKGPVIKLDPSVLEYYIGCSNEELLKGVTARDKKDGDVSSSLIVSKRILLSVGNMEVVSYVACDKTGNVTTSEVLFKAESDGTYKILSYESYHVDVENMYVSIDGEDTTIKIQDIYEAPTEDSSSEEGSMEEQPGSSTDNGNTNPTTPKDEDETTTKKPIDTSSGKPVIVLKNTEITVTVGKKIKTSDFISYIESIIDDVDSEDTLFRRVSLTNTSISTNKAGVYTQGYYCYDTDKNRSETVYLTVKVVEEETTTTSKPDVEDKFTLTINYVDKATGSAIYTQYVREMTVGNTYYVQTPDVEGYTLVNEAEKVIRGTMPDKNLTITVEFEKIEESSEEDSSEDETTTEEDSSEETTTEESSEDETTAEEDPSEDEE